MGTRAVRIYYIRVEQRTPVNGADKQDLRPRLFEYPALALNEHLATIEIRHYGNSAEVVNSISEADDEDLLSFKLVEKGVFCDGHPGCTQLLHQGGSWMEH